MMKKMFTALLAGLLALRGWTSQGHSFANPEDGMGYTAFFLVSLR